MNSSPSITFKETLTRSEVESLLDELIRSRVQIKAPEGLSFIVTDLKNEKLYTDLQAPPKCIDQKIILEIFIDQIKYELETEIKSHKDSYYLLKPRSIHKFQRRENYRTAIPKTLTVELKAYINQKLVKSARIVNISLTGALIAIQDCDSLDFQDQFNAELKYEEHTLRIEGDIVRIDLQSNELFFAIQYNTKMAAQKAALHQFLLHCFRLSKSAV